MQQNLATVSGLTSINKELMFLLGCDKISALYFTANLAQSIANEATQVSLRFTHFPFRLTLHRRSLHSLPSSSSASALVSSASSSFSKAFCIASSSSGHSL